MLTAKKINALLQSEKTTTAEALTLFDQLASVDLDAMMGRWQGFGLHTDHPLDGWLEVANWYGKEFITPEHVHPLLFSDSAGQIFKAVPLPGMIAIALRLPILKNEAIKPLFNTVSPLLKTEKSQARLRLMEHRGKVSATMSYDHLPINDVFRKIDENTVLGLMDCKALQQP
ncbi:MAG: DUF4334 domain-containing protein, partial [Phormidesmis sp.]